MIGCLKTLAGLSAGSAVDTIDGVMLVQPVPNDASPERVTMSNIMDRPGAAEFMAADLRRRKNEIEELEETLKNAVEGASDKHEVERDMNLMAMFVQMSNTEQELKDNLKVSGKNEGKMFSDFRKVCSQALPLPSNLQLEIAMLNARKAALKYEVARRIKDAVDTETKNEESIWNAVRRK